MTSSPLIEHAGDPRHADHDAWLLELGRATLACALVAGICFDLLRVIGGVMSADLYNDPLGTLAIRLKPVARQHQLPGMDAFLTELEVARQDRNDLLHALPVLHGLHRRRRDDLNYVRNFYDVADVRTVTTTLTATARAGNRILYHDGGESVRRWYQSSNP